MNVLISSSNLHACLRQGIDACAEFIEPTVQTFKDLRCGRLTHGVRLRFHSINIGRSR